MKRFTETEKWRDSFFRALTPKHKLAVLFLFDACDAAGVWDPDYKLADFLIGEKTDWESLKIALGPRLAILPNGKWFLPRFVGFQQGKTLNEKCHQHTKIMALLESHGVTYLSGTGSLAIPPGSTPPTPPPTPPGSTPPQSRVESNRVESIQIGSKTDIQLRIESWFHRKPSTKWSAADLKAWEANRATIEATAAEDMDLLERRFSDPAQAQYRRRDLSTLINNWTCEIDRARNHTDAQQTFRLTPQQLRPAVC